jgi:DNA (cytosine-5)-methyltransferase 1
MGRADGNRVLFNEYDPFCAAWLENLFPETLVDGRDIHRVKPLGLTEFTRCHFFAGIGGWELALQLAGWPVDRPVWTGSCPCQPFSTAGRQKGINDPRHLWPEFYRLIKECRPPTIFGEQVASKSALDWLDTVAADLESEGYAFGTADLCAAGVGAPHIRQRLFFVANAEDSDRRWSAVKTDTRRRVEETRRPGFVSVVGNGFGKRLERRSLSESERGGERSAWSPSDVVWCRDGKWRPTEPGTFPLAHGVPGRVGKLRAYGNAIVPQVAATFVRAFMEAEAAHG